MRAIDKRKSINHGKKIVCMECGEEKILQYPEKNSKFCSRECVRSHHRRHGKRRRKAKIKSNGFEPYNDREIFMRDGWICKICGKKVKKKARVPHHMAPTIDHIVPIDMGGQDSPINVQLACFKCNYEKGTSILPQGEQLLLL